MVSIRLTLDLAFEPDQGKLMVCPTELAETFGPREIDDDWATHWLNAQKVEPELQVPWDTSASIEATRMYARFGYAVESYMLSTSPYASFSQCGRARRLTFHTHTVHFTFKYEHL